MLISGENRRREEENVMNMSDYICEYFKYSRKVKTDCYDYCVYKCKKYNIEFDEFHDKCEECKDDTTIERR